MTVEDVLSIATRGTVVTGKIEQGTLNVGDEVAIVGNMRKHRQRGVLRKIFAKGR